MASSGRHRQDRDDAHRPPAARSTRRPAARAREALGRVLAVSGAQVTVGLTPAAPGSASRATVGKFLGIVSGGTVTVGLITEIAERPQRDQDPVAAAPRGSTWSARSRRTPPAPPISSAASPNIR